MTTRIFNVIAMGTITHIAAVATHPLASKAVGEGQIYHEITATFEEAEYDPVAQAFEDLKIMAVGAVMGIALLYLSKFLAKCWTRSAPTQAVSTNFKNPLPDSQELNVPDEKLIPDQKISTKPKNPLLDSREFNVQYEKLTPDQKKKFLDETYSKVMIKWVKADEAVQEERKVVKKQQQRLQAELQNHEITGTPLG
jgi:hypothetical protein